MRDRQRAGDQGLGPGTDRDESRRPAPAAGARPSRLRRAADWRPYQAELGPDLRYRAAGSADAGRLKPVRAVPAARGADGWPCCACK